MGIVFGVLAFVVFLFLILLFVRLALDWVQVFAREWRPRGVVLVVAEVTYTITDPPLRAVRRVVPPLTLGSIRLDLAFLIVFFATSILFNVLQNLAATL
ncbi:membrane protein [Actinotalea ferrariae CF5-4]|uniref:Membrane protein n=1 Tax=Actinotalea ferrariae CF5-4 TaxID=948458 RepID=A0A021VUH3_9CELL|nr:YggT family protein [Actinotalea ferrariae]EYR64801.1 membrane protein [Actinotalea ferrariae CF5-4]